MSKYLFIESRDPFESRDSIQLYGLIKELASKGNDVALFLVQNGTLSTRKEATVKLFPELCTTKNVTVYADDYSLEERGIRSSDLREGVKAAPVDTLTDLLMESGRKPMWH